jgi:hypothetical protein
MTGKLNRLKLRIIMLPILQPHKMAGEMCKIIKIIAEVVIGYNN